MSADLVDYTIRAVVLSQAAADDGRGTEELWWEFVERVQRIASEPRYEPLMVTA